MAGILLLLLSGWLLGWACMIWAVRAHGPTGFLVFIHGMICVVVDAIGWIVLGCKMHDGELVIRSPKPKSQLNWRDELDK